LGGALAMVSFVAGTIPALIGVALLGRFFGKSHGPAMRAAAAGLFLVNGVVLAVMAVRMLG
jgi:sulfite exporter TauE/SafE